MQQFFFYTNKHTYTDASCKYEIKLSGFSSYSLVSVFIYLNLQDLNFMMVSLKYLVNFSIYQQFLDIFYNLINSSHITLLIIYFITIIMFILAVFAIPGSVPVNNAPDTRRMPGPYNPGPSAEGLTVREGPSNPQPWGPRRPYRESTTPGDGPVEPDTGASGPKKGIRIKTLL